MVGEGHPLGLSILGHHIADIDLQGVTPADRLGNPLHQQVGNNTGVKASRPQQDQVGPVNGLQCGRQGSGMLRQEPDPAYLAILRLLKCSDFRLSPHRRPILKGGFQRHIVVGHRQDMAGNGQNLTHFGNRLIKRAGDAVEGCQQQIAKRLTGKAALGKPVAQQLLHQRLGIGQRLHTVSDIARGRHSKVGPQHSRPAAVIGHGDNGGNVSGVLFQPPEHGGKTVAAADRHHTGTLLPANVRLLFHHCALVISRWFSLASYPLRRIKSVRALVTATERCCPPVQPTAMTSAAFPSSTYCGRRKAISCSR